MAEQSHTPGPWFPVWNGHYWDICTEDREYAQSIGTTSANNVLGIDKAQDRANARLIAAAPELLEALRLILPLAKGYRPEGQTATARATCNSWVEAAEEAIAKATGGSV